MEGLTSQEEISRGNDGSGAQSHEEEGCTKEKGRTGVLKMDWRVDSWRCVGDGRVGMLEVCW